MPGSKVDTGDGLRLTLKQRRFVSEFVANGGNGNKAAKAAGYACPHPQASENLQKPTIRDAVARALDRTGLTIEYSTEVLRDVVARHRAEDATDRTLAVRGLDMAFKLRGAYVDQARHHDEPPPANVAVIVQVLRELGDADVLEVEATPVGEGTAKPEPPSLPSPAELRKRARQRKRKGAT